MGEKETSSVRTSLGLFCYLLFGLPAASWRGFPEQHLCKHIACSEISLAWLMGIGAVGVWVNWTYSGAGVLTVGFLEENCRVLHLYTLQLFASVLPFPHWLQPFGHSCTHSAAVLEVTGKHHWGESYCSFAEASRLLCSNTTFSLDWVGSRQRWKGNMTARALWTLQEGNVKVLPPLCGESSLAFRPVNRFRSLTCLEEPRKVLKTSFWIYFSFYQAQTKLNMINDSVFSSKFEGH